MNGEKTSGPFSESTLKELRACGMLGDDTLVAREGTEDWTSFIEAFRNPTVTLPASPSAKGW